MDAHAETAESGDGHHQAEMQPWRLAFHATWHCLLGCGTGEVIGVIIGTALGLAVTPQIILAVSLGAIFGILLGLRPWRKAGYSWKRALRRVIVAEGASIAVMEAAEVTAELYLPGLLEAGFTDWWYWVGLGLALAAGFVAAYPVNYIMARRGVAHHPEHHQHG